MWSYVVPLYVPPGPRPSPRVGLEVALWTRLFPHVPGWWIAARLIALGLGAMLLAWAGSTRTPFASARPARPDAPAAPVRPSLGVRRLEWSAFASGLALCGASLWNHEASRWFEIAVISAIAVPLGLLRVADAWDGATAPRRAERRERAAWIPVALVVIGWVVLRVLLAHHDPRAADVVDGWKNFTFFRDAANATGAVSSQASEVGVSNAYLLLLGLPFVGPGKLAPTFAWIQSVHGLWIAATAAGVAALARRLVGSTAMLPAVAMLLFSPFMLSMAVSAIPLALATAIAAAMLLLVCRIHEARRRADVLSLGVLAAFSATLPQLTLWGAGATLAVLPLLVRRTPSLVVWFTAASVGLSLIVPVVLSFGGFGAMSGMYLELRGVISELEPIIMGQRYLPLREIGALWHAGVRGTFDVPIATLLQPFAILRSPVRLSGDVYFEPIGAALAAVGIATCVALARRARTARLLLAALALALLPGMLGSAFDRASLTRNLAVPVLLPLLSVVGVEVVREAFGGRPSRALAAGFAATAIAVSGIAIFDVVNPRIVAESWLGIVVRALGTAPAEQVLILEHGDPRWEWLWTPEIAGNVPPEPIRTRPYANAGSLLADPSEDAPAGSILFWSPALEEEKSVRRSVCACWPHAVVYELRDRSGLSRVLAANLGTVAWTPALPETQRPILACPARSDAPRGCDVVRAMAYYDRGRAVAESGRPADAVADYREALRLDPTYVAAYNELGLALAATGRFDEAIPLYRDAIRLDPGIAPAHNNLAIALESTGRVDEALAEYAETVRLAPDQPRGRLNLGSLLLGRGRAREALLQYDELLRRAPSATEAHLGRAEALFALGRRDDAAAAAENGLALARERGEADLARALEDGLRRYRAADR
ncbi:MAG TPA: tetratricopeptide repeat protein [Candidatus Binatia bacterium]|nr:tetratricopeptide repeat protein [Candidatus Binatia bacterium]